MLAVLLSVIMGALIGYGTNTLAVEMLFHPYKPIFLGKMQLPFTPGLIPKEQIRISDSLGDLIEKELFSQESITEALCSDETKGTIMSWLNQVFESASSSDITPRELAINTLGEENYIRKRDSLCSFLSFYIIKKASRLKLGESIARNLSHKTADKIPFLKSESLEDVYANTLGKLIDRELKDSLPELVENYVRTEAGNFFGTPLSTTMNKVSDLSLMKANITELIHTILVNALPKLIQSGQVKKLVYDRINSLEPKELNIMFKNILKKELAAIEWLGALLGAILGGATALISNML